MTLDDLTPRQRESAEQAARLAQYITAQLAAGVFRHPYWHGHRERLLVLAGAVPQQRRQ